MKKILRKTKTGGWIVVAAFIEAGKELNETLQDMYMLCSPSEIKVVSQNSRKYAL